MSSSPEPGQPLSGEKDDSGLAPEYLPLNGENLGTLSPRRGALIAALLLFALHLFAAGRGGLLDGEEIRLAELAAQMTAGEASLLIPEHLEQESALRPPLALWLGAAGIATIGQTSIGARLYPALLSGLLIFLCFVILQRRLSGPFAAFFCFSVVANPKYLLHCGQLGPTAVATASLALAFACLLCLLRAKPGRDRVVLSLILGIASGMTLLAGSTAAVAVIGITAVVALFFRDTDAREAKGSGLVQIIAACVLSLGCIFLAVGLIGGRAGWPSAASLLCLLCDSAGESTAGLAWIGTLTLLTGALILRSARARTLGFPIAIPLALMIGASWYIASFWAYETSQLCAALQQSATAEWPSNNDVAVAVIRIGYGLYPWMALLPLSVYRISTLRSPADGHIVSLCLAAVGAALFTSFTDTTNLSGVAQSVSVSLLAFTSVLGLMMRYDATRERFGERAACVVGVLLLYVVMKDLLQFDAALASLALPHSYSSYLLASKLPQLVGVSVVFGLALVMLGTLDLCSETIPRWLVWLGFRARYFSTAACVVALSSTAFFVSFQTSGDVGCSASWADIYKTFVAERNEEDELYAWREVRKGGLYYANQEIPSISRAFDVRRVLSNRSRRIFFATEALYFREISRMVERLTGQKLRSLETRSPHHILAIYQGPPLSEVSQPVKFVQEVPERDQRTAAKLASGGVQLVGSHLSRHRPKPGDTVSVRLYLKCIQTPARDIRVRIRLKARHRDNRYRLHADHDLADSQLPAKNWQPRQILIDESEFVLPWDAGHGRYGVEVELIGSGSGSTEIGEFRIPPDS